MRQSAHSLIWDRVSASSWMELESSNRTRCSLGSHYPINHLLLSWESQYEEVEEGSVSLVDMEKKTSEPSKGKKETSIEVSPKEYHHTNIFHYSVCHHQSTWGITRISNGWSILSFNQPSPTSQVYIFTSIMLLLSSNRQALIMYKGEIMNSWTRCLSSKSCLWVVQWPSVRLFLRLWFPNLVDYY